MVALAIAALFFWTFAFGTTLWGTWVVFFRYRIKKEILRPQSNLPPVSIIKPLKGIEDGLAENLRSFFELDYPRLEILFCAAPNDPVVKIVHTLLAAYPTVAARLFLSDSEIGPNPKVNNMLPAYNEASFDHIWISDSNVRVSPNTLSQIVHRLGPKVGAVTAVIAGIGGRGLGGWLECTSLNSFYARWMYLSGAIGSPFVVGKLMFFRRSTLERFGGMPVLSRYIAEDYIAGEAIRYMGFDIAFMHEPVLQFVGTVSLRQFWARHLRWGRIRKLQNPIPFLIEPFAGSFTSSILGALSFWTLFGVPVISFVSFHLSVWFLCDSLLMFRMSNKVHASMPVAWLVRELMAFPLWVQIACGNQVDWRGNRLRVRPGGMVTAYD